MAGDYLSFLQGDTYSYSTTVALNGVAQNVFGASLWFLAKMDPRNDTDAEAIITATSANGEITVGGNNNSVVTMSLNSDFTANLAQANVLFWALKMQTVAGAVYTLDRGRCCVAVPVVLEN